jgi:putative hydrolase of the HAD superfamily
MDFNRGLRVFWEKYYRNRCPFEEMKAYGEAMFDEMLL